MLNLSTSPQARHLYEQLGFEVSQTEEDEKVLSALHVWFDTQVKDHGNHATADK